MTIEPPKWPLVAEAIARRIRSGDLPIGQRLPTVQALADENDVSIKVMQKALDQLAASGAVERRANVGIFVKAKPPDVLPAPPRTPTVGELAAEVAELRARVERLESERPPAP